MPWFLIHASMPVIIPQDMLLIQEEAQFIGIQEHVYWTIDNGAALRTFHKWMNFDFDQFENPKD
jgi:hypothetical protein